MRWAAIATLGAGLGLALFCGAGAASADPRADTSSERAGANRSGVDAPHRQPAGRQRSEPRKAQSASMVRAARTTPVSPRVTVALPQVPVGSGRSFTVSEEAVTAAAEDYVGTGGDPADAPRFFFGDLAVTSLERLAEPSVSSAQIRTDLGNLTVSGYFGGVWLRDNLRAVEPVPVPADPAPVDLTVPALAIGLFDTLAAGLTAAADSTPWLRSAVAHATVPVLLALYGYNRGYLEFLLENPPAGVPSMQDTLSCTGFLGCSSSAFPIDLDTRYDAALTTLEHPDSLGWWEMKAWSAVLESATGTGRFVWQQIAGAGRLLPGVVQRAGRPEFGLPDDQQGRGALGDARRRRGGRRHRRGVAAPAGRTVDVVGQLLRGAGVGRPGRDHPGDHGHRNLKIGYGHVFPPRRRVPVSVLYDHHGEHPGARYLIEFPDGESYICRYFTSYESENSGELDIEMDDPRYDEFYQIAMDIIETIQTGTRRYQNGLTLDYRDWPALIKDLDRGTVVYPAR